MVGAYRILEHIGEGTMGRVYLAEHELIGRRVALKLINPAIANDPDAVELFFREARAANQIQHPNIIQVTDLVAAVDDSPAYMVMEHLEGATLRDVLDQERALEPRRVAEIAETLASAMAAAHNAGVIHRDLKPENIFLCAPRGEVKILDFGIARIAGARPVAGDEVACGSALYISPEQAGADGVDEQTDVYALGAILYEALAGRPVFDRESVRELLTAHIADTPVRLVSRRPGPARLASLVMRCLEKDAADRPTMEEVAAELRELGETWNDERDRELERLIDTMWDRPPRRRVA